MNNEQRERLQQKIDELKKQETTLIKYEYCKDDCHYCAVGFLAKDEPSKLELLKEWNNKAIVTHELEEVRKWFTEQYGIGWWNITQIQSKNDVVDKQAVIEYLEGILSGGVLIE